MTITLIFDDRPFTTSHATAAGEDLWLSETDLTAATGWENKPQGLCHGDRCVPLTSERKTAIVDANGRINVAAFARYLSMPVVHDDDAGVWLVGEAPATRRAALHALDAPDFRLPDLDGTMHALSDFRGKKVLLLSWASW